MKYLTKQELEAIDQYEQHLYAKNRIRVLEESIHAALCEIGVPSNDYPANVSNAHELLSAALTESIPKEAHDA